MNASVAKTGDKECRGGHLSVMYSKGFQNQNEEHLVILYKLKNLEIQLIFLGELPLIVARTLFSLCNYIRHKNTYRKVRRWIYLEQISLINACWISFIPS